MKAMYQILASKRRKYPLFIRICFASILKMHYSFDGGMPQFQRCHFAALSRVASIPALCHLNMPSLGRWWHVCWVQSVKPTRSRWGLWRNCGCKCFKHNNISQEISYLVARSLILTNLCACCVSDIQTRNIHASVPDIEQLPYS